MVDPLLLTIFITIAGFAVGLGSVTVIDILGFLGRNSNYWTETTTRAHKVTKPLIWVGIILVFLGGSSFYKIIEADEVMIAHLALITALVVNGFFLSFKVSPYLQLRESEDRGGELLPNYWQKRITLSFLISFLGWWTSVALFSYYLTRSLSFA